MDDEDYEKSRIEKLGFKPQKEIIYNKLLPYADELDKESLQLWTDIKTNLARSILLREIRPGCVLWTSRLNKYMKVYGLKFSKEDHIALIKLMFDLVTIPDLEPTRVNKFATTLTHLLKKNDLISPDELELPWRPLYDLCERILSSSEASLGMYKYFSSLENVLDGLVHACRFYFPAACTQEMLDEWRPMLCPFDNATMASTVELLDWFLPISAPPALSAITYDLWLQEFMQLWDVCHNAPAWETDMMWLMARLANYNVGYVDWEPYMPLMFTRFLRSLDLPVSYRQKQSCKHHKIETTPMACWIIATVGGGSSTLRYLEKFMQTLESYYHPANVGRWGVKLRELFRKLPFFFVQRLHRERHKEPTWQSAVPDAHKLTEADIDRFVDIMKPIVVHAIYSRQGVSDVSQALQHLATVRPATIIPLVLDKIYSTLDSLTEPHKLTASMQCLVAVARPMVQGPRNGYADGPTHVIPLLMALLPGVDPNDIRKCFVTFQFVSTFILMIPLVNSAGASAYYTDLTEEEHAVCEATAGFEDFVLQFFDRIFGLIENSSMEATRLEQVDMDKRSKLEAMAECALSSICVVIATQTSPDLFMSALRKLYQFVTEHILETKVAGHMLAVMVRSFTKVNSEETLKLFVPYLYERINELLGENDNIQKEERLDNELAYNLCIFSEMLDCNGTVLLPYMDRFIDILDRTLHLTCQEGSGMASRLLDCILTCLTVVQPMEFRSIAPPFVRPLDQYLSIREWGKAGNIHKLGIQWYQPGEREIECVQMLLNRYLPPEIECLEAYMDGSVPVAREELRRTLHIILAILGAQTVLPMWQEPAIQLIPSKLKPWAFEMIIGPCQSVSMPDGSNVRQVLVALMHKLQQKILECAEDDTKSLFTLIAIWDTLLMNKFRLRNFEAHWKNFHAMKKLLEDRLHGNKGHLRQLLVDRAMLHQEFRTEVRSCTFTETHRQIIIDLYVLSTSHYSEVRIKAQKKLFCAVSTFPYGYTVLTPHLKRSLQVDSNTHHEQFKGCLYVLLGPKSTPIVTRHDWHFVNEIWPALVRSQPSEKPSVINLMGALIETVHKNFPTISMRVQVPDSCVNGAKILGLNAPTFTEPIVTDEEIREEVQTLIDISETNKSHYFNTLDCLLSSIQEGNLHWRYHSMALSFIRDLVHPEVKYNDKMVRYVLQTLLHESIEMRKLAIRVTVFILKQHKQPHKKLKIDPYSVSGEAPPTSGRDVVPGCRKDNHWMQYDSKTRPQSSTEWDQVRYMHKQYHGYYTWPKTVEVYAPSTEQPSVERAFDQLVVQEQEVALFFSNQENIDRLVGYLSMEEKKGKDKFNGYRFIMFKNLFRNYGDAHVPLFLPHLERLVMSKEEHDQRAAAEIIAAMVRGSKHWPFGKVDALWRNVGPLLRVAMANMTVETVSDWGICFATASEGRDPNRHHWLYELLMEDPLRSDEASFIECGRLYTLQGALNQQTWRVSELFQRLFAYLNDYLTHPFQNVRERISSTLTNMFETDLVFPGAIDTGPDAAVQAPRITQFMAQVVPKLNVLYAAGLKDVNHVDVDHTADMLNNVTLTDNERDVAIRLFKTVSRWVIGSVSRSNYGAVSEFYQLFPLACLLQSYEADEELSIVCSSMLAILAQAFTLPRHIPAALEAIRSVVGSRSWSARAAAAEYVQVFVFHNMATILSNEDWVSDIKSIVLKLLEDDQPEVRIQASQVLGGLLHCQFIPSSKELLDSFKKKAKTRLKKTSSDSSVVSAAKRVQSRALAIRTRHTGVLGICAFINAHPYDVPDYLPDVFLELGAHLNDPQPIPTTIRKTLGDFKRTHLDNWEIHQLKFTEDELAILSDLTVPPSYYA